MQPLKFTAQSTVTWENRAAQSILLFLFQEVESERHALTAKLSERGSHLEVLRKKMDKIRERIAEMQKGLTDLEETMDKAKEELAHGQITDCLCLIDFSSIEVISI